MHNLCLSNLLILALFTGLGLAVPVIPISSAALSPRCQSYANDPLTGIET